MIIDIHAHAFAFDKRATCHLNNTSFLSAKELIALMDEKGIDKAAILPLVGSETPTEPQSMGEVLHICEQYPSRFIPFCCFDPRQPLPANEITVDLFVRMLNEYKQFGCKGFGEFIPRLPWNDFRVERVLEACGETSMPVIFHTTTSDTGCYGLLDDVGLPLLEQSLAKFSKTILVGHSPAFWSEISGNVDANTKNGYSQSKIVEGGAVVRLMREYPNLYCDISAGSGYNAITRDPDFTWKFIEEFADRILFGQDVCSHLQKMNHRIFLTDALNEGNPTKDNYEKIMWQNANRLFKLELK